MKYVTGTFYYDFTQEGVDGEDLTLLIPEIHLNSIAFSNVSFLPSTSSFSDNPENWTPLPWKSGSDLFDNHIRNGEGQAVTWFMTNKNVSSTLGSFYAASLRKLFGELQLQIDGTVRTFKSGSRFYIDNSDYYLKFTNDTYATCYYHKKDESGSDVTASIRSSRLGFGIYYDVDSDKFWAIGIDQSSCKQMSTTLYTVYTTTFAQTLPSTPGSTSPTYLTTILDCADNDRTFSNNVKKYMNPEGTLEPPNPYPKVPEDNVNTTDLGGNGNYDMTSDPQELPPLPTGTLLASTGFFSLYRVTLEQLDNLSNFLYDSFSSQPDLWDAIKGIFGNPIETIIALYQMPFTATLGVNKNIKLGNINTNVTGNNINVQYKRISLGSVNVAEYFGSVLDYVPYTKCEIFLPFFGFAELDINQITKATVNLIVDVDFLTGACVYNVMAGSTLIASYNFNPKLSYPITAKDQGALLTGLMSAGVSVGTGIATGNPIPILTGGVSAVNTMTQSNIQKSGSLNGSFLGWKVPFLHFSRPIQTIPANFTKVAGYNSNYYGKVKDCNYFVKCEHIILSDCNAFEEEKTQIINLLKNGCYVNDPT